jgi:NAD(P)-dependent dehydrogenase (short-subunit alcohol dehydrogenase family)
MKTASLFSLTSKTAVVTGRTGGIGLSVVPSLAELGADIVSIQIPNDPQTPALRSTIEQHGRTFSLRLQPQRCSRDQGRVLKHIGRWHRARHPATHGRRDKQLQDRRYLD